MRTAEFVDYRSLPPGSRLEVETRNRHYDIECLGGSDIRISGHPEYCPTPVAGELQGSSDRLGIMEPGLIGTGRHLNFVVGDCRPVTTSRVIRIRVG
ncbi:MAG: hypothetical protein ABI759_28390 [Candidatus Solibacter sp.]